MQADGTSPWGPSLNLGLRLRGVPCLPQAWWETARSRLSRGFRAVLCLQGLDSSLGNAVWGWGDSLSPGETY